MKMKKRYGAIFATLFLCIAVHAQDFQPMEYNGLLYQELACNVADKEDAALVVYLHGRHASGSAMPVTMHSPQSGSSGCFP